MLIMFLIILIKLPSERYQFVPKDLPLLDKFELVPELLDDCNYNSIYLFFKKLLNSVPHMHRNKTCFAVPVAQL